MRGACFVDGGGQALAVGVGKSDVAERAVGSGEELEEMPRDRREEVVHAY